MFKFNNLNQTLKFKLVMHWRFCELKLKVPLNLLNNRVQILLYFKKLNPFIKEMDLYIQYNNMQQYLKKWLLQ